MQVYRNCWQPSSKEKKTIPINANRDEEPKPNQKPTSYPIDVVWYGRLIVPTSLMTAQVKGPNRMRENRKYICDIKTGNGIIMHVVKNKLRHGHKVKTTKSKQRRYDLYVHWSINRWPSVHQLYLVVQLSLGQNTCNSQNIICHNVTCPRSAHRVGHFPLCSIFNSNPQS